MLSRLFHKRFLEELGRAYDNSQLQFFGEHAALSDATAFADWFAPLHKCEWVVYAKRRIGPFLGFLPCTTPACSAPLCLACPDVTTGIVQA